MLFTVSSPGLDIYSQFRAHKANNLFTVCMDILIFLITVQEGFDNYRGDEIAPGAEVQTDEQIDQFIRCQNLKKIRLLL